MNPRSAVLLLRRIDGRLLIGGIELALPQTLRVTGGNHAQAEDEGQDPEQVRFTLFH